MPLRIAALALFAALLVPEAIAQAPAPGGLDAQDAAETQSRDDFAPNPVAFTPAEVRLEGHDRHLALEANSLVRNVPFRNVGPTVMSGRVTDLDVHPTDPATFYVAYASGGLWRTTSGGTAFEPLFDQHESMTIGDIAVRWSPAGDEIWVGTGENNSSRSSYAGTGVYRSRDGGATWEHLGLEETHHVGRIVLHPSDPNTAWVAAIGHLYSPNEERGVYKTTDGGRTWSHTLFVDEDTGVIDLVADPSDPEVLYAAAWERARRAWNFVEGGPGSGIYKSTDGGETWRLLDGFPSGEGIGRIGIIVAPSQPNTLYAALDNQNRRPEEPDDEEELTLTRDALRTMSRAQFLEVAEDDLNDFLDRNGFPLSYTAQSILEMVADGSLEPVALVEFLEDANSMLFDTPVVGLEIYRSDDGGATWRRTHEDYLDDTVYSYGYYFGEVRVSPQDPDRVYTMGVPIIASSDGGATWASINEPNVHVDHHALWVSPTRPGHLINGNDGGVNVSFDDGRTWMKANVPPVGQFYTVAVDMAEPYRVYGGLQDNGVWRGPHTNRPGRGWVGEGDYPYERIMGGDGMQTQIDPRDNETVYTGFQFGNYFRVNAATGEATRITPQHELGERPLRFNWQTPIHLSRHNADILYLGSNRFHRSLDQGATWEALSGDLTRGGEPGDVPYGTLSSIDESPLQFGLLYAGSDDGLVHRSADAGASWQRISDSLPAEVRTFWVSRVEASPHDRDRVYVSLNGYRWDNFEAHVYRSDDAGRTWSRIGGDLPHEPVNVIAEDPERAGLLYVGTDHGVYVSFDDGASFMAFDGAGTACEAADIVGPSRDADDCRDGRLPNVPVHDLLVHPRDGDLVVGTHGRSIYISDVQPLQALTEDVMAQPLHVFEPQTVRHSGQWGARGYTWSDPFEPAVEVTYWSGTSGAATVTITNEAGETVRTVQDDAERGLNTVRYDLSADEPLMDDHEPGEETGAYYLVPGAYTVTVSVGGASETTTLTIEPARERPSRRRRHP